MDLHLKTDISRMSVDLVSLALGGYDRILKLVFIPDIGYDLWSCGSDSFIIHTLEYISSGDFLQILEQKRNLPSGGIKTNYILLILSYHIVATIFGTNILQWHRVC